MKKNIRTALVYAILAMAGGVFFREFTKFNGYAGVTALGKVHTHLFMMGMMVFLIAALFSERVSLCDQKLYKLFYIVYNIGVPLTALMMLIRGITQVLNIPLTSGLNASVSGIAGIGHILSGTGIVLFLIALSKACTDKDK